LAELYQDTLNREIPNRRQRFMAVVPKQLFQRESVLAGKFDLKSADFLA